MKAKIILIILSLHLSLILYGQEERTPFESLDLIKIYFSLDKKEFNNHYKNNEQSIKQLRVLLDSLYTQNIDSIRIIAAASPEGNFNYNRSLSEERAKALKKYILSMYPHLSEYTIRTQGEGEDWTGLKNYAQQDHNLPFREDVINILSQSANPILKEKQLRGINSGVAWRYLNKNAFDDLRFGIAKIYWNPTQQIGSKVNTLAVKNISIPSSDDISTQFTAKLNANRIASNSIESKPLFALKTNLLADAITSVNIEIEVPIGKKWSVGAEWMFPWWIFSNNKYYNQLLMGTIEGRYWLHTKKQNEVLSGHAIGLYMSSGYYDFQWKKKGYQGEIIPSVGLSYTYAQKIGKHFRMEYSLGLGILNTKYRKYTANDHYNQFPWLSSGRTLWVGPSKAEVSFVWLISKRVHNEKR